LGGGGSEAHEKGLWNTFLLQESPTHTWIFVRELQSLAKIIEAVPFYIQKANIMLPFARGERFTLSWQEY
jgi:hypothetical protein